MFQNSNSILADAYWYPQRVAICCNDSHQTSSISIAMAITGKIFISDTHMNFACYKHVLKPYNSNSFPHWHWTPPLSDHDFFSFRCSLGWIDSDRLTPSYSSATSNWISDSLIPTMPARTTSPAWKHGPGWLVIYDCQAQIKQKKNSWNGWSMIKPISPGKTKNMNIFEKTHIPNMRILGSLSLSLAR